MVRRIKVHTPGAEVWEVTVEESKKILEDTYKDPMGGVVADLTTGEVIWSIGPDVTEIIIVEPIGGG